MGDHTIRQSRRRLLFCFLILIGLVFSTLTARAGEETSDDDVVGGSGTVGGTKPGKTGKPGTTGKPPSAKRKAILTKTNPCKNSAVNSPEGRYIDGGKEGIGMYQPYQCNPQTGWVLRFVCYERCPEGTPKPFVPPAPPTVDQLYISLYRSIPAPNPLFAPPVDQGNNIAAIVGKRLYVNLTTNTFETKEGDYSWSDGYWYATFLIEPNHYQFTDGTTTTGLCTTNDASARTSEGRKTLDEQNCSLVINNKPPNGTNVPFFPQTTQLNTQTTYPVPIKQIQSIIIE
jgi:hypothetical protein